MMMQHMSLAIPEQIGKNRCRKVESMGFWNPLQDVLVLMNIPISNISNYISDEEMIEFTTDKLSKGKKYLLEDFMNDVEKLL